MTILYAEDDSMTVMEVQEKLENNGYEVIVAYDGNEALEKFIACKPDLIVLDVDMPGKDGLEVLQFIRLQDSQTPVIIYSCLIGPFDRSGSRSGKNKIRYFLYRYRIEST